MGTDVTRLREKQRTDRATLDATACAREGDGLLTLPIADVPVPTWLLKVGNGWPDDTAEDVAGPAWSGVVPARITYGPAVNATDLRIGITAPSSVLRRTGDRT